MELLTAAADPWTNDLFENLNRSRYWAATPYRDGVDPCIDYPAYDVEFNLTNDYGDRAGFYWQWGFTGWGGIHGPAFKTTLSGGNIRYAWAVHDGNVLVATATATVPVPAAIYLFGSGLIGLCGMMKKKAG